MIPAMLERPRTTLRWHIGALLAAGAVLEALGREAYGLGAEQGDDGAFPSSYDELVRRAAPLAADFTPRGVELRTETARWAMARIGLRRKS